MDTQKGHLARKSGGYTCHSRSQSLPAATFMSATYITIHEPGRTPFTFRLTGIDWNIIRDIVRSSTHGNQIMISNDDPKVYCYWANKSVTPEEWEMRFNWEKEIKETLE